MDRDFTGLWGVAQSIGQQVAHCPVEHQAVAINDAVSNYSEPDLLFFCDSFVELQ